MSINRNGTVIAIFEDQEHAHHALNELREAGFSDQQVGFVYREGTPVVNKTDAVVEDSSGTSDGAKAETVDTGHGPALDAPDAPVDTVPTVTLPSVQQPDAREGEQRIESPTEEDTQPGIVTFTREVPEAREAQYSGNATDSGEKSTEKQAIYADEKKITLDEATGVLTGSIVGGVLGAAAALFIPALGIAFAGGFLVTAFSTALGAVTGGFLGTLVTTLGIPEEEARQYENEFKAGRTIVTVRTDDQQQEALNILSRNKAWYTNTHEGE